MTEAQRKAVQRRRKSSGFVFLGKFIRKTDLHLVEPHLLTASQVDEEIEAKKKGEK